MTITRDEILHVAQLARLTLSEQAMDTFSRQIDEVLTHVTSLNQVDTTGVPPTSHAISLTNAFREDEPGEHLDPEQALANAPDRSDDMFQVPRVVG